MRALYIITYLLLVIVFCVLPFCIAFNSLVNIIKNFPKKRKKIILNIIIILICSVVVFVSNMSVRFKKTDVSKDTLQKLLSVDVQDFLKIYEEKADGLYWEETILNHDVLISVEKDKANEYYIQWSNMINQKNISVVDKLYGEYIFEDEVIVNIHPSISDYRYDMNIFEIRYVNEIEILSKGYVIKINFDNTKWNDEIIEQVLNQSKQSGDG